MMKLIIRKPSFWLVLALMLGVAAVWTVSVVRAAEAKTLDQRTYEVASQLQCPVCHGESVADAPSPLAQEMRSLIREDLRSGMSEQEVITYFHERYGDQILETPPTSGFTLLIWLGPLLVLLFGATLLFGVVRDSHRYRALAGTPAESRVPVDPADGTPDEDGGFSSPAERERYQALLLAEMDELEGYSSPGSGSARPSEKGGALI
jgi:cytochrome c-type biogenesis protein CcmH